jgi:hypothetical protein
MWSETAAASSMAAALAQFSRSSVVEEDRPAHEASAASLDEISGHSVGYIRVPVGSSNTLHLQPSP